MLYTVKDRRSDYLPSFGILMDQHEAAVVFTTENAARTYVAGLGPMYRTVELRGHVLLDFLLRLRVEGIKEMMVDPRHIDDPAAATVTTYDVLREAAECIETTISDAVPATHAGFKKLMIVACARCKRVERVSAEDTLPLCCGEVMRIAATDSRQVAK